MAAASVLERRLGRLPLRMLYVPKGPVLDWANADVATQVLADLEGLARDRRALLIKIDPNVFYPDDQISFAGQPHAAGAEQLLRSRGWRFSSEQIQFRNTALLNLRLGEEELLAAMKPKTRYNVRLAARRGVTIRRGDRSDLEALYELYAETSRRNRFFIRPAAYYRDTWSTFLDCGLAWLFLAEVDSEPIAGLVLFAFRGTAWYLYGASSDRHRDAMPNHLLQWEAVRTAQSAGCTCYDLWGAPENMDEDDPLWGVWRFKAGFGAAWAPGLGAWDYAPREVPYRIYSLLLPRYVGWMQRRYRAPS
jgi:peptidoglycan pentaglycine glycine transferase (the first glycine)